MRQILSLLLAVVSLGIIVVELVSTTLAADAKAAKLREELTRVLPPSGAVLRRTEASAATRKATATAVFEGKLRTVDLLAHYRRALEADGWSECGTSRSGYVYTGEIIRHYRYCKNPTDSATLSIEKASDAQTTQYELTFEWNTRSGWISVLGLGLALTAIIGLQIALRQPLQRRPSVIFRTELRFNECRERLESLAGRGTDVLMLRRCETSDSIARFEMERRRRRWWDVNVIAGYFYASLRPEDHGARVEGRFGLSPGAKSVSAVVGVLFLIGVGLQARRSPASATMTAGVVIAVVILATLVAPRFWRTDRSLVEQALERVLEARRVV